ncbi:MAG: hypothetical protein LBF55_06510 [Prevotellaceae bacterium]|jgi:hypothetical protein|nr:hypothetical protein [Prevotellaceae bacterium]
MKEKENKKEEGGACKHRRSSEWLSDNPVTLADINADGALSARLTRGSLDKAYFNPVAIGIARDYYNGEGLSASINLDRLGVITLMRYLSEALEQTEREMQERGIEKESCTSDGSDLSASCVEHEMCKSAKDSQE